jgi:hypothetical protein
MMATSENIREQARHAWEGRGSPDVAPWKELFARMDRLIQMAQQQPFLSADEMTRYNIPSVFATYEDLETPYHFTPVVLAPAPPSHADSWKETWQIFKGSLSAIPGLRPAGDFVSLVAAVGATFLAVTNLTSLQGLSSGSIEQVLSTVGIGNALVQLVLLIGMMGMTWMGIHYWIPTSFAKVLATGRRAGIAIRSPFGLNTAG